MYDQLLKIMEPNKEQVSFYSRMEAFNTFLEDHNLIDDLYEDQPEEPVTFIWAISSISNDIFTHQIKALSQIKGVLQDHDQMIFVADVHRRDSLEVVAGLDKYVDTKQIIVNRGVLGDRPTFNWDIGLEYAKHERVCLVRDLVLFFQPWDFVKAARELPIEHAGRPYLWNFTTVLGPLWSRYTDQWVYLVHPKFAPTPYMFALVAAKSRIQEINGFDQSFRRGFDHSGELDFLLRWSMHALHEYEITDKAMLMHPGLPANEQDVEEMKFQSSITRRVFMDRYDEKQIMDLKAPYSLELPLVEVNYAHTYPALMEVEESSLDLYACDVKDLTTFSKRPSSDFIVEVI